MDNTIIKSINDFNDENFKKVKSLIESGSITSLNDLDKLIDYESINKNQDSSIPVSSIEFKKLERKTTNEMNKLLNKVLPKVCKVPKPNKIDIKDNNMDDLINLIEQKIGLITEMIKN
jgi:hypothetical protein